MIWFGYSGLPKSLARSGWYLYVSPSLFFRVLRGQNCFV